VPREELIRRPLTTLKRREQSEHTTWLVDSLGRDTVQVPRSVFQCAKLKLEEGVAATADYADSSTRTEVRDTRWVYMTPVVPITHLAREKIENSVKHKSWLIGHSQEGTPMLLVGLSQGDARLVDYGTGLESGLVPAKFRKSFRQQEASARGAVELGEREARHRDGALEFARLRQAVLPQRGIEHQQHVMWRPGHQPRADALHLLQLGHEILLGVQAAGGIDQHHV